MFDFGALPPEINSGRMYNGPGSGSMIAAASAWDGLAAELHATAMSYDTIIAELTSASWIGPASRSMLSAAIPYVGWLSASAGQAEQAASQARAATAAYETAFTLTVPPPVIAANRVLLMTLIGTNFFGQNFPAIAMTEAEYLEMWAQDATAMYGYAASSANATELSRFSAPPNITNSGAAVGQSTAVAHAAAAPADSAQLTTTIPQLLSAVALPQAAAQQLGAAPAAAIEPNFIWNTITDFFTYGLPTVDNNWAGLSPPMYNTLRQLLQAYFGVGLANFGWSIIQQLQPGLGTTAGAGGAWYPTPQFAALGAGGWHFHGGAGFTASIASSAKVGGLSVPVSWNGVPGTSGAPFAVEQTTPKAMSANSVAPASEGATNCMNSTLGGVPAGARGAGRAGNLGVRYGVRYTVVTRPPSAG